MKTNLFLYLKNVKEERTYLSTSFSNMKKEGIVMASLFCLIEVTMISATVLGFNRARASPNLENTMSITYL